MISKDILTLPGANWRQSALIGIMKALGSLAEMLILLLAFFSISRLFGLSVPSWCAIFVAKPTATILWLLSLLCINILCSVVANDIALKIDDDLSRELSSDFYLSLFDPDQKLAAVEHNNEETSNQSMAMLSTEGIKSVCTYFANYLPTLIQAVLMIAVTALVVVPINWVAGLIIIAGMLVLPFSANMLRSKQVEEQVTHIKQYYHIGVRFEEALRGLSTLKIFHADQREADRLHEDSEGFRKTTMKLLAGQLRSLIGSDSVIYISAILATIVTVRVNQFDPYNLMYAIIVAVLVVRLFAPERQLMYLTHAGTTAIKQGKTIAAARANRMIDHSAVDSNTQNVSMDESANSAENDNPASETVSKGITIQDLSLSYPNGMQALKDINLSFPSHGHFGVVGASGSGKSTLASLIAGRLAGYEGSLTIDDQEVSALPVNRLISLITVVKGNDHLFAGTVRSNLDPAGLGYSDEALEQVLRKTDLQELLEGRGGLDSPIDYSASNLSGGQRQRLLIARALLRESPIYIFDEATSAVDRDHDQALASLKDELGKESLVITITHRLAGVSRADNIIVLDQGIVAQSGTFEELANHSGIFAQQWKEQDHLERLAAEGQQSDAEQLSNQQDASLIESSTESATNSVSDMSILRRMAHLMRQSLPVEIKAIVCGSLGHLCSIGAVMLAAAAIIGYFTTGNTLTQSWRTLAVSAIVLALLVGPFAYGEQYFNHQMAFSTLRDIRDSVFNKMRSLAPAILEKRGRGNLVTVITHDIELLEIFYAHTLSPICIAIVVSVFNTAVIFSLNRILGITAFMFYLFIGLFVPVMTAKQSSNIALAERNAQGSLHSHLLEALDGRTELIGLGAATNTRDHLYEATNTMIDARKKTQSDSNWNDVYTKFLVLLAMVVFASYGWILAAHGQIPFTPLVIALTGFVVSFAPIVSVARLGSGLQPTLAAARRVFSLMDEQPAVQEITEGTAVSDFSGIEAKNLTFSYQDKSDNVQPVLNKINLTVKPGTVVGIQGNNGSGKTTFIDLLMHFRERTGGELTLSGQPIEAIRTENLRNLETLVSQDTFIFSKSLSDNIAIAKLDASEEEIAQAAKQAHLDDVINQLPDGMNHVLVNNGSELSDGQKQRIAVARAFLSQAPFIALDEPTSNMDALLEGQIIDALVANREDKTYFIASHRPAVLAHTDKLYTLKDGKISVSE